MISKFKETFDSDEYKKFEQNVKEDDRIVVLNLHLFNLTCNKEFYQGYQICYTNYFKFECHILYNDTFIRELKQFPFTHVYVYKTEDLDITVVRNILEHLSPSVKCLKLHCKVANEQIGKKFILSNLEQSSLTEFQNYCPIRDYDEDDEDEYDRLMNSFYPSGDWEDYTFDKEIRKILETNRNMIKSKTKSAMKR